MMTRDWDNPRPPTLNVTAGDRSAEIAEHAPGPWLLEPGDSVVVVKAKGTHIASVGSEPYWKQFTGADAANARLIATAPDMLAALRGAMVVIDTLPWPEELSTKQRAALNKRRSAIIAAITTATTPLARSPDLSTRK